VGKGGGVLVAGTVRLGKGKGKGKPAPRAFHRSHLEKKGMKKGKTTSRTENPRRSPLGPEVFFSVFFFSVYSFIIIVTPPLTPSVKSGQSKLPFSADRQLLIVCALIGFNKSPILYFAQSIFFFFFFK